MPGIFISYRREDSAGYAGRIYDRLCERFGRDLLFMDVSTVEPGIDFVEAIEKAIGSCDALVALIGLQWLPSSDEDGQRRLNNPEDLVRLELASALARNIRVIPVTVRGALMPRSLDLPDGLKSLARRNALEISDTRFHVDIDRLIQVLEGVLGTPPQSPQRELGTSSQEEVNHSVKLLDEAENYLGIVANDIRTIVHPHRRKNPLPLVDLFNKLQNRGNVGTLNRYDFSNILMRLQQHKYLPGIVFSPNGTFIEEEYYAWKTTMFTDAKRKIASMAMNYIHSGNVIVLDAGSTTLEITHNICEGLKMGFLDNLTIVTNSISSANALLTTASEMGLGDENKIIQVYIFGGRIRPNTLAIVEGENLTKLHTATDFSSILDGFSEGDIAFVGTNGIHQECGFTTKSISETRTKRAMLRSSKKKFVVTDPSKFGIKEENVFATFDQDIKIITTKDENQYSLNLYEDFLKNTTTSILFA